MRISNLKRTKDGAVRVELEDGAAFRVSDSTVLELGLCRGMEIDSETQKKLCTQAGQESNRAYALRAVSRRALSEKELCGKLTERGCRRQEIDGIIAWLRGIGALNDDALTESLVQHYLHKNYGRRGIASELRRRGIDDETASRAIESIEISENRIDEFISSKLRGKVCDRKELDRVAQMLLRRGHGWSDIRDAIARYENSLEE